MKRRKYKKNKGGTISKHFSNDEILYVADNGDIHLKPGVHRLRYNDFINPDEMESHINETELGVRKIITSVKQQTEVDNNESDI